MIKVALSTVLSVISLSIFAADVPQTVIGAEKYDAARCNTKYSEECINNQCLTSSSLDCQDQCRKRAKDKCDQLQTQ